MTCKNGKGFAVSAKSTSFKVFWFMAVLTAALAASLLCGAQPAWADSVQYVEKSWNADSKQVVSTTKTAECTPITSDTKDMGGATPSWYVVNGNVVNDNRLVVWGVVNIILTDGSSLTLKDGISVQSDRTLNIYAQSEGDSAGALICGADTNDNAAIGSNEETGACGTINIHGGKVTADTKTNGEDAAGIGGGEGGDGGNVTIYGGIVKAIGGSVNDEGGAGIGGGDRDGDAGGNGGTTVIYGGDVTAIGGANAAGIGGGDDGGDSGNIYIYGGTVNATGGSKNSRGGAGIGGGGTGGGKCIEIRGGNVIARGGANAAGIGGGDEGSGGEITITGGTVNAKGGSVYSDGGAGIGGGNEKDGGTIRITGGEVTSQGGCDAAGIGGGDYGDGGTITITGGTISATGGKYGAGIGGGQSKGGGTITITGGTVTAISGVDGAGIGGGENGAGGTITINSSSEERITAKSVENGAGIGGGDEGAGGNITIENGQIIATGGSRLAQVAEIEKIFGGAGIGGGCQAAGGEITINDGNIEAQGGYGAAGIGGGSENSAGMVSISGGTIVAKGGVQENGSFSDSGGAGIGNGYIGSYDVGTGTISISGGNVTATGAGRGAGIGGGSNSNCSKITISGGTVNATGDIFAAGIGGGNEGKSGTIHITGGDVTATGGESGAGIGSGCACDDKTDAVNVTIDGGTVHASAGGEYEWHTGENDERKNWETRAGAAIGAGGNRYMKGNNHREENTYSYFSGAVRLNGGEVYLIAKKMCVIGSTEFAGLVADTGRVEFNGAKVVKQGESYTATMVNVSQGQVILKENDTLHQMVLEDDYPGELDFDNPRMIVPKDDRISYLISSANHYIAVIPCDHRNSTYEDKGTVHNLTCKYCTYEKTAEEHTYGEPTYTWSNDNAKVTASHVCTACKHEDSETVDTESEVTKEATCAEKGETTYTATFENDAFEDQSKTVANIDALDHDWNEPTYTWNEDKTEVTATRTCKIDANHKETETVGATSEVTKEPTEEADGERMYTSESFTNPAFSVQTKKETIPAKGHDWGKPTYDWAADNREVKASRALTDNPSFVEVETVTPTITTVNPNCTETGTKTYTASFTNTAFETQTKTEEIAIDPEAHEYGAWVQTKAPTCSEKGAEERVCSHNSEHKETRDVDIDPAAHAWGEPTYEWATDNSSVTATRVCAHDASHEESETATTTSAVTKEPTETEEGEKTYTAAFTNPAFAEQTKTESIPKVDPKPEPGPTPESDISYENTKGDGTQWTKGGSTTAGFTFKRSTNDDTTYSHFTGIQVDGADVDESNYTAEPGSVVIKLKPAYLETLAAGEHTLTALFDDGNSASAKFTIVAKDSSTDGAAPNAAPTKPRSTSGKASPNTADNGTLLLLVAACVVMLAFVGMIAARRRSKPDKGAGVLSSK